MPLDVSSLSFDVLKRLNNFSGGMGSSKLVLLIW